MLYIFVTYHRSQDFFKTSFPYRNCFLGIVMPLPVISNGPCLKKALIDHVTIINIQINNNQHAKLLTQEEKLLIS